MTDLGFMTKWFDVLFMIGKPGSTTDEPCADDAIYREIRTHKNVLANRSDVFEAMFYGCGTKMAIETNSDGLQVVKIEDIGPDVFQFMIDCMYNVQTTSFTLTDDNLEHVAYTAEKYDFKELRDECVNYMADGLSAHNCVKFWFIAKKYNIKGLETRALEMASPKADFVFYPLACRYADVEMWKLVLSNNNFNYTSFSDVVNNAIYWATNYQGCETLESIRDVLKPLQPLLQNHIAGWKLVNTIVEITRSDKQKRDICDTNLHAMYNVFFPDFKIPRTIRGS